MNAPVRPEPDYSDAFIHDILTSVRSIALVGASANAARPSNLVMRYLLAKGYHVIPVNPGIAGKELLGQKVIARLGDIGEPVDMVDIFRASDAAPGIVREALAMEPRPRVIWMQLGVTSNEGAELARAAGLKVVMNRCPKIEFGRLSGEIGWAGINRRIISSRRASKGAIGVQHLTIGREGPGPAK